jgi:hypothetical protein
LSCGIPVPFVMRGLDPRIHRPSQDSFKDGLPGQARQ